MDNERPNMSENTLPEDLAKIRDELLAEIKEHQSTDPDQGDGTVGLNKLRQLMADDPETLREYQIAQARDLASSNLGEGAVSQSASLTVE